MQHRQNKETLPSKANRILNGILVILLLVLIRIWHLSVIQHDEKLQESRKPQIRVVAEECQRATIYDRFHIPLAINKVQYNAAISYGPIRELPRWIWKKDEKRKRIKFLYRKEYITELSEFLGQKLHLDPVRIEDLIHSKAAILGNVPCVIKENISEEEYFRLKMLEKDWPGIYAHIEAKRCYPQAPTAAEIVGYIGPISREQYNGIIRELHQLRDCIAAWEEGENPIFPDGYTTIDAVKNRLEELEKKAYTVNDVVGKMGVEAQFDEELRGIRGKQIYLADTQGSYLRKLVGSVEPRAGSCLTLTISSELQAYAERLLVEYDQKPPNATAWVTRRKTLLPENQPWQKEGAIVVMDPHSGEIYALASYPRFDSRDFIRTGHRDGIEDKNRSINKWLESETHLAHIWDLKIPHSRERIDLASGVFFDEKIELGWKVFLDFILPQASSVRKMLDKRSALLDAIQLQKKIERLLSLFGPDEHFMNAAQIMDYIYCGGEDISADIPFTIQKRKFFAERLTLVEPQVMEIQKELAPYFEGIHLNYEKLLLVDLYRLAADATQFSPELLEWLGRVSIEEYREACGRVVSIREVVHNIIKNLFHEHDFKKWREESFKEYLAEKRKIEKENGVKYARPYIEYLDQIEKELFEKFWEEYQWDFNILFLTGNTTADIPEPYLSTLKNWAQELQAGAHGGLKWRHHYQNLQRMTQGVDSALLKSYIKTMRSYDDLNRPLVGKYSGLRGTLEKDLAASFYPTFGYGHARSHAFRQAATIGSIFKLVPAYEALVQRYQKGLQNDLNPLTIIDDKHQVYGKTEKWNVGFTVDGKAIPLYYCGGRLPRSDHYKVGSVDLVAALGASSNPYFSLLAGDVLKDPEDLCKAAALFGYGKKTGIELPGEYEGIIPQDVAYNRTGLYSMAIGQHSLVGTPLQVAVMLSSLANGGRLLEPQILKEEKEITERWRVFLPAPVQHLLLSGLKQAVMGEKGTARGIRTKYPPELVQRIIGKTSTAEAMARLSLDGMHGAMKIKHTWFGAISYESDDFSKPELVVIVYLRYGDYGNDAAPRAVEMIKKWREIKKLHAAI